MEYDLEKNIYDNAPFEVYDISNKKLKVLDCWDTLNLMNTMPKNFCRFGDGEIMIIEGKSIPFQKYDRRLAEILKKILIDNRNDMYVGVNYNYFNSTNNLNDYNRRFYIKNIKILRESFLQYCNRDRTYISASFNQVYMSYKDFEFQKYYLNFKRLFKDKEIVIFAGDGVFKHIDYDIFEMAKSKSIYFEKSKDSFDDFDLILEKCMLEPSNKMLLFILGPCSKALVYELTKRGRIAWDIGHLAKDYDWYMKQKDKNAANIISFSKPD